MRGYISPGPGRPSSPGSRQPASPLFLSFSLFPCPGRLSFPHPTRLASPATEAVESALDPDLTTASHALPITHWLQVQHCDLI